MASVVRTIRWEVWNCTACVENDCVFLISEDETSGCYRSILGRPKVKRQIDTFQDCEIFMGNGTTGSVFFGDLSSDLGAILGSGTVGALIGVLVAIAVCCYFLRQQRQHQEDQDPEMVEHDDNGGFRVGVNYSPRTILRAIGNGLRAGAIVSRVVRQLTHQQQNDRVPLVQNEEVEHPAGLEGPQQRNQGEGIGRGRRARAILSPRIILQAARAGIRVGAMVRQVGRQLSRIGRAQNQPDYVDRHPIEGFENIGLDNLARAEPPGHDQNQLGAGADRENEPPQPLIEPERDIRVADNPADDVDNDGDDTSSTSTDSTLVPEENYGDLIFDDALSDPTESSEASESELDESLESAAGDSARKVEEADLEDQSEAGSSFSIGSSESTPSRRIQPGRKAKTEGNEMIKALRNHKLI